MTVRRRTAVAFAAALLFTAGACSSEPDTTWMWPGGDAQAQAPVAAGPSAAPSTSASPPAVAGGQLTGPVIINQSRTGPGERRLAVETDGAWTCDNCAGDGKNSTGRLNAAQLKQLRDLMADPAFGDEDGIPPSNPRCGNRLESNMTTSSGVVLWSSCAGAGPPPVSVKILRLLSQATPLNAGLPG